MAHIVAAKPISATRILLGWGAHSLSVLQLLAAALAHVVFADGLGNAPARRVSHPCKFLGTVVSWCVRDHGVGNGGVWGCIRCRAVNRQFWGCRVRRCYVQNWCGRRLGWAVRDDEGWYVAYFISTFNPRAITVNKCVKWGWEW